MLAAASDGHCVMGFQRRDIARARTSTRASAKQAPRGAWSQGPLCRPRQELLRKSARQGGTLGCTAKRPHESLLRAAVHGTRASPEKTSGLREHAERSAIVTGGLEQQGAAAAPSHHHQEKMERVESRCC